MKTMRSTWLPVVCALASGCAAPLMQYSTDIPALELRVVGQPGARDGRARFREIFCALLPAPTVGASQSDCERYLVRLADEPPGEPPRVLPAHDPRLRILFVRGAFGECFADAAPPYSKAIARLSEYGYPIGLVPVSGRSGTTHNAAQIAHAVSGEPEIPGERLVLVGYSKGTSDILEFLVSYPVLAQRVDAVLSIAGAVNGTPLADAYAGGYALVADIDLKRCGAGDGEVLESLRYETRMSWLARNQLPDHIRYFSLGSLAQPQDIARLMFLTRRRLDRLDPRHDGQVVFYDQIIPASTLLGYAYGDHWAVALPLQEEWPYWGGNSAGSTFPRDVLFEAAVLYVVEEFNSGAVGLSTNRVPQPETTTDRNL